MANELINALGSWLRREFALGGTPTGPRNPTSANPIIPGLSMAQPQAMRPTFLQANLNNLPSSLAAAFSGPQDNGFAQGFGNSLNAQQANSRYQDTLSLQRQKYGADAAQQGFENNIATQRLGLDQQAEQRLSQARPTEPTPGVDVPFSPDVEAQKLRLAPNHPAPFPRITIADPQDPSKPIFAFENPQHEIVDQAGIPIKGARPWVRPPSGLGNDGSVSMTPQAIDMAADVYVRTGQLPPLGMGASGLRQAILNRAGEIAGGNGTPAGPAGGNVVVNKETLKANSTALSKLRGQRSAVGAFETTALKNLDLFENSAKSVVDSGSPWINEPLRLISGKGLGSNEIAAMNTARQVALTEISRVVNNPNLTGVLSDSARGEIGSLIGLDATLANIYAAGKILRQDMANRKVGLDQEIANLEGTIRGGNNLPAPAPASHPATGGLKITRDANGRIVGIE